MNVTKSSSSFFDKYQFFFLLIVAIIITRLPIISIPFNWLESYFHEISHGFAAIISGGSIIKIELFTNGAGLCTTMGGNRFLISFMGYAGAILWGLAIYKVAFIHKKSVKIITLALMIILGITIILWVRDLLTLVIVSLLIALFYFKWKLSNKYIAVLLQLTGMLVLLNAVLSPLHLLDGRHIGDGAALASITGIPEIFWVIVWSGLGAFTLFKLSVYKLDAHSLGK